MKIGFNKNFCHYSCQLKMNVSFYLNTQLKTRHGDHPVYMYITYNGKRIRKPVAKVHTSVKYWDEEKQRIKRPAWMKRDRSINGLSLSKHK
jgi:hypothetical protein